MDKESVFVKDDSIYGDATRPVPKPQPHIGVDQTDSVINKIADSYIDGVATTVDMAQINSMTSIAQSRDSVYTLLDTMAQDSSVSAILDAYAAYSTEYNDEGKIVWVESSDADIAQFITYLLDTLQVDKHIYSWTYSLIKYGDVYLRLYKKSEYENELFPEESKKDRSLNEDVYVHAFKDGDTFAHYVEQVKNPAEVFELTKFGETQAYIQTDLAVQASQNNNPAGFTGIYRYSFQKGDTNIYPPNMFVHGCLEEAGSRYTEKFQLFLDDKDVSENGGNEKSYDYIVRRGKSILYDNFKIWRERSLVENSLLLNRVTKSSIVRIIGVEVGDMPKEQARQTVARVKSLIEQKTALNTGASMSEYTNPGPIENSVYMQTRDGKGVVTTTTIGGDVNIKDVADLDYLNSKFYGSFNIPKEYFGFTDDNAGFNGGSSLSIISSGFAKEVKRIQNAVIQMLSTVIKIFLVDKGMTYAVNKFKLHMLPPTTQEELDRRENTSSKVQLVSDVTDILSDIEDPVIKLKLKKSLLSNATSNTEVIQLIDEQIRQLEAEEDNKTDEDVTVGSEGSETIEDNMQEIPDEQPLDLNTASIETISPFEETEEGEENNLPTPDQLGIDMTQNIED